VPEPAGVEARSGVHLQGGQRGGRPPRRPRECHCDTCDAATRAWLHMAARGCTWLHTLTLHATTRASRDVLYAALPPVFRAIAGSSFAGRMGPPLGARATGQVLRERTYEFLCPDSNAKGRLLAALSRASEVCGLELCMRGCVGRAASKEQRTFFLNRRGHDA